jgi:hypothetical protein
MTCRVSCWLRNGSRHVELCVMTAYSPQGPYRISPIPGPCSNLRQRTSPEHTIRGERFRFLKFPSAMNSTVVAVSFAFVVVMSTAKLPTATKSQATATNVLLEFPHLKFPRLSPRTRQRALCRRVASRAIPVPEDHRVVLECCSALSLLSFIGSIWWGCGPSGGGGVGRGVGRAGGLCRWRRDWIRRCGVCASRE